MMLTLKNGSEDLLMRRVLLLLLLITKEPIFLFKFAISLHIDDLNVLTFIRDSLSLGSVKGYPDHGYATYSVSTQKEVLEIRNFFDSQPLNTIKHFNFLAFKKAFLLYKESKQKKKIFFFDLMHYLQS